MKKINLFLIFLLFAIMVYFVLAASLWLFGKYILFMFKFLESL